MHIYWYEGIFISSFNLALGKNAIPNSRQNNKKRVIEIPKSQRENFSNMMHVQFKRGGGKKNVFTTANFLLNFHLKIYQFLMENIASVA